MTRLSGGLLAVVWLCCCVGIVGVVSLEREARVAEQEAKKDAPLPQAWGVVYARPNPDGSRKSCQNCMMFIPRDEDGRGKCSIHARTQEIKPDDTCGYHVFGTPMDKWMDHPGMDPVDPKYSGLGNVPGGTSCDVCVYYEGQGEGKGLCHAVASGDEPPAGPPPVTVEAKGCCSRWEGRPAQTEGVALNALLKKISEA